MLRQAVDETDALTLSYLDRVISFEFAALNYFHPTKNRYRYMLEGFDQDWTEVRSDRRLEMAGQEVLLGITDDVTEQVEAQQALATFNQMSYDMASISNLQVLIDPAVPHLHQIVDFQRAALMLVENGEEFADNSCLPFADLAA